MPIKDPAARREYHRNYMRNIWYPQNKTKHIESVRKITVKRKEKLKALISKHKTCCVVCGETETSCLDFHHCEPHTKDFDISAVTRRKYSDARILKEIAKCVVLCANCHRKLHAGVIVLPK